jgi:rare lipoprotein A
MKISFLLGLFCLLLPQFLFSQEEESKAVSLKGKATYYASKFVGRKTTSGQVYRHEKFTAAHKTLPFGTEVTVVNPRNGKSVVVVINDRGPFHKHLMIDLSQAAAKAIGIIKQGIAPVEMSYTPRVLLAEK